MKGTDDPSSARLRPPPPDRYREFSRLGEGSMGVVYLALDTELNRRVAFKMIRPPGADPETAPLEATPSPDDASFGELRTRFLQEAWVTGGLEHPGIVPVYELGRTTGGVPYYTMRLVRGEKTLAAAIEEARDLDARLALLEPFLKVCDAVRYAHARGVIHRDLKPANIALGAFGETVVLDWGLAKLKDRADVARTVWQERVEELRDETDLKTLASAIGTPGYMAPEAALLRIDEVDERSDVYSLGAILYRLLTGRLPFRFTSYAELVERLVAERPQEPTAVDPALPRGLSAICMRALTPDKADRYADADDLAAAVRAWQRESAVKREVAALTREAEAAVGSAAGMQGEALLRQLDRVTALTSRIRDLQPGHERAGALQDEARGLRDRAIAERERGARKRLLRRVAVVGLVTATAATVLVALLVDAKRREAEEARTREGAQRRRAQEERTRAEDLANFMLFDLHQGLEAIGRLDLLDEVARKSKTYYESLPPEGLTNTTLHRRVTALVNVGDVLTAQGNLAGALESYRAAHALAQHLVALEPDHAPWQMNLCATFTRIGQALQKQGDLAAALASLRDALAINRRLVKRDPSNQLWQRELNTGLSAVANVLWDQGNSRDTLEVYQEALAVIQRVVERDPSNVQWRHDLSSAHNNIAVAQRALGNLEAAQLSHEEALAILQRLVRERPSHAEIRGSLANTLSNLGGVLKARGDVRALETIREATTLRRHLSEADPTNASCLYDLSMSLSQEGDLLRGRKDWKQAEKPYAEALAVRKRLCALDPSNTAWQLDLCKDLCRTADCRIQNRDLNGAEQGYREALALARRMARGSSQDPQWLFMSAICVGMVGDVLEAKGDAAGHLDCLRESLAICRRYAGLDPDTLDRRRTLSVSLERLACAHEDRGDWNEALKLNRESVAIRERLVAREPEHLGWQGDLATGLQHIGLNLRNLGRLAEAAESCRKAIEVSRSLVQRHPQRAGLLDQLSRNLFQLALVFEAEGNFAAAAQALGEAREVLETAAKLAPQGAGWQRLVEKRYLRVALLAGERSPDNPADRLVLAGALYDRKEYARSAKHFAMALEDAAVRGDLERYPLYNGACVAALASAAAKGAEAAKWRARALEWLAEDLRLRRDVLQRIEQELKGEVAADRRAALQRRRESLRGHFEHARTKDPDLASLRGTQEFEALFAEGSKAQG
ncbi:MAG: serine/threonine-protein kinase [Planctomycetota bacterium]|jgi:tetratricopeptide (TPR) repeat protein